jgi:hypothetical protein
LRKALKRRSAVRHACFSGDFLESSWWFGPAYAVAKDGRFLMIAHEQRMTTELRVVQKWAEELGKLARRNDPPRAFRAPLTSIGSNASSV